MEDSYGPARSLPGLEGRPPCIDAGRIGGVFCRLQRERFDGVLRVESAGQAASIGFRAGCPVTLDDAAQGHTLGDVFVERGQLTRAQCNSVIARMTDGLVEDEAVAFCDHAVALGYMSEEEVRLELSERIRTRMIQVLSWKDCTIELEPGEAALYGRSEFPQELGAIVYMGVRTFYEDDFIAQCLPDIERTYLRLLAAPASISHFFGLDDDEFQLLRKVDPDAPIAGLLKQRELERTHLLSLIVLLALSEQGELSSTPFTQQQERERSGARPAPRRPFSHPLTDMPAESGHDAFEAMAPDAAPMPPKSMEAPLDAAVGRRISRPVDATQEALLEAAARTAKTRKSSSAVRRAPVEMRQPPAAPPAPRSVPAARLQRAATQPSVPIHPSSAAATPSRPSPHTAPVAPEPHHPSGAHAQQVRTDYAKAHLDELVKRRKQTAAAPEAAANGGKRDPARELRQARDLLRDQHYARAEEVLRGLLEKDPESEVLRAYHMWSRFRAQPDASESLNVELRELAKKLVQDSEHGPFANYALGHLYFHAKRDDLAEKFFKRAHASDRTNKDAERHVLILERRKQQTAEQAAAANRKIFGIQISNAKPKP